MTNRPLVVAGLDEAGRGAWAGPVVAAAVILPPTFDASALRDSKQLTPNQREALEKQIRSAALVGVGTVSAATVDRVGIKAATRRAMLLAVQALSVRPDTLLIDGCDGFRFAMPSRDIVRGDTTEACISAASIVAKVHRDALMRRLSRRDPRYGFDRHKGYGTAWHQEALRRHGPSLIHRCSFAPVSALT